MSARRPFSQLAAQVKADPARRQRVEADVAAMRAVLDLMDRLAAAGRSRDDVERAIEAAHQAAPSPGPSSDIDLSTLRRYVEGLGGRLEISAVFPDETIVLRVPGDGRAASAPSARSA